MCSSATERPASCFNMVTNFQYYLCDAKQECCPDAHSFTSAHVPVSGISSKPIGQGTSESWDGTGIGCIKGKGIRIQYLSV